MNPLTYYARQSPFSDPAEYGTEFAYLPIDVPKLCRVVQGLLIHHQAGKLYDIEFTDKRKQELDTRYVSLLLKRLYALDTRPFMVARVPEARVVSSCRDFALLLCSMLRQLAVPARIRFGFSGYFVSDFYYDHVVCEYWCSKERRWVLVDAQQDDRDHHLQYSSFNPQDVPRNRFLTASTAWLLCRTGKEDPTRFGFAPSQESRGQWVICNSLVHDLAALYRMELLIWDVWGLASSKKVDLSEEQLSLLDRVAVMAEAGNSAFSTLCSIYASNADLRVPAVIQSYSPATPDICASIKMPGGDTPSYE